MSGRYSLAVGRAGTERFRDLARRLVKSKALELDAKYAPRLVLVVVDRKRMCVRTAPADSLGELATIVATTYHLLDQRTLPCERALEPHERGTFDAALAAVMDLRSLPARGNA